MDEPEEFSDPTLFKDSVGQRLRSARETAGLDLADIASQTRIPLRHLTSIESSDYSNLPSSTYSVGFVKTYARAVGLDDAELGRDLRTELGTLSPLESANANNYEPVDPMRIPPKWLAWTAVALALLLFGGYMLWRHNAASDAPPEITLPATTGSIDNAAVAVENSAVPLNAAAPLTNSAAPAPSLAPPATTGTVVLTATKLVWLRIYDADDHVLHEGEMKPGESYTVPADAKDPQIRIGAADLINVTVAGKPVATLGKAQRTIKDVHISAAALLARTPLAPTPPSATNATTNPSR